MTAEEVLKKHFLSTQGYSNDNYEQFKGYKVFESILNAMEEFALSEKEIKDTYCYPPAIVGIADSDPKKPPTPANHPKTGRKWVA